MPGIRVPDAQYEAPTPTPEQAQVPVARQPQANANMFGAAQAEAGAQAGEKVQGAAVSIADRMIEMKQWNQQSQMYDDKESYRKYMDDAANDQTTHTVIDSKTGQPREVPNGWNLITNQDDIGTIPQLVESAKAQAYKLYGPQSGVTLLPVAKQYSRYLGGINSIYDEQANKRMIDQTKQNTVASFQGSYQKAMQATGSFNSFIDYHNNLNDINIWKNAGVSAANESTLSAKDMQGLQKNNFSVSGNKFYQDKIWSGQMTADQANKDLDNAVSKMPQDAVGDVDSIKKEIAVQSEAYQTEQKKQGEIQVKNITNKNVGMIGAGLINAKNVSVLATSGMDPKLVEPLTNAVLNVEKQKGENKPGFFGFGAEKKLDKAPINEEALGLDDELSSDSEAGKEAKSAADYTIGMANSLTHAQAADVLVKAINSGSLDKEQLNVYTRTLALVGQYLPTETEAAQGKTVDPQGVTSVSAYKDLASWGKQANLPDVSHLKNFLDNNDNNINPQDNVNSVKTLAMNRMFPQTVSSGKTPNIAIENGSAKRYFMQRATDQNSYPMMYDEGSKMVIPNRDYKQPRQQDNGTSGT